MNKLTESKLRSIIREELSKLNEERADYIDGRVSVDGAVDISRLNTSNVMNFMSSADKMIRKAIESNLGLDRFGRDFLEVKSRDGFVANRFGNYFYAVWVDFRSAGISLYKGDKLESADHIATWTLKKDPSTYFGMDGSTTDNTKSALSYVKNQIVPELFGALKASE